MLALLSLALEVHPTMLTWIAGVLAAVGLVSSAVAVARQSALRASMDAFREANAELRRIVEDQRTELATEQTERRALEAKLELFTGTFANQLVEAVVRTARSFQSDIKDVSRG